MSLCFVQRHFEASTCQLGSEGLPYALPVSEVSFSASTAPLPRPFTDISDFKSNLVCRVVVKATSVRLIDDTRNGCGFRSSKPVRKSRLFWQEETRQSTALSLGLSGEKLGLNPSKIQELIQRSLQWQGVMLEGRRYFQAIKKGRRPKSC